MAEKILKLEKDTVLSGCRIKDRIGQGGMGTVYRAEDEKLSRPVAIKLLHESHDREESRARFLREARSIAQFKAPGIVQIYSFSEFQGHPYFVMEYVDGDSLDSFIKKARMIHSGEYDICELREMGYLRESDQKLTYFLRDPEKSPLEDPCYLGHVYHLIREIAKTLELVHSKGIVHRDIKPSNILISRDGSVKLVDFGLVKSESDTELTRVDQVLGTLNYMAPEQFMGKKGNITQLADIFSLNAVFYELVTLKRMIDHDDLASITREATLGKPLDPRKENPDLSRSISKTIMRNTSRVPSKRMQSCSGICDVLDEELNPRSKSIVDMLFGFLNQKSEEESETTLEQAAKILSTELEIRFYNNSMNFLSRIEYENVLDSELTKNSLSHDLGETDYTYDYYREIGEKKILLSFTEDQKVVFDPPVKPGERFVLILDINKPEKIREEIEKFRDSPDKEDGKTDLTFGDPKAEHHSSVVFYFPGRIRIRKCNVKPVIINNPDNTSCLVWMSESKHKLELEYEYKDPKQALENLKDYVPE